jgi:hypothetical protein
MSLPGFRAEASLYKGAPYRSSAPSDAMMYPGGQPSDGRVVTAAGPSSVICGVCRLQGCECERTCHDCGPFGWFTCCDDRCVNCTGPGGFGGVGINQVFV